MRPLAERMRPAELDQVVGQDHILAKESALRKAIENDQLPSMILWGPPGVGKTTLAHVISQVMERPFHKLSAVNSGVKQVRQVIEQAANSRFFNTKRSILFIDEIHRFSKSQQDALLGAVEEGTITLIGATTENPSFEVNSALLSRCQVYTLNSLEADTLRSLMDKAISHDEYLSEQNITIEEYEAILALSGGDARRMYNVLELVIAQFDNKKELVITNELVESLQVSRKARFDKKGDQHYDIISAFIKSVRGSDPQASVYWLARMLEGGEDIKFIARRLIILASEDVGLANPNALLMANQCAEAVQFVGMPEARIILSQATIYLANSAKSNATYTAINDAISKVKETGDLPVPLHLRNAPTKLMKDLDYGMNYKYPHDYPGNYVEQQYLPDELKNIKFYKKD